MIPDWETKVPHAFGQKKKNPKNVKQKQYHNKLSKDFKKWSTVKKKY